MAEQQQELREYEFGIVFRGRFEHDPASEEALNLVEEWLVVDLGFSDVRGGAKRADFPACECLGPNDCDDGPGCVFRQYRGSDEEES